MSSIPSTQSRAFQGVLTTFLISGATYTAVSNFNVKWGYKIMEEIVVGTNTPYLGTGVFHGELDGESIGSSDARWENAVSTTSGLVPSMNIQWKEQDTQGTISARTWTASGVKFTQYEMIHQGDKFVKMKLKGILLLEPLVS